MVRNSCSIGGAPLVHSTPKQPLVSIDMNSRALVRPVKTTLEEVDPKSKCPPAQCVLKREKKTTLWVQCDRCNQWFHQWCVKISKRKAEKEDFFCVDCR